MGELLQFNLNEIWTCFLLLFTITDMLGNIPIILSLNKDSIKKGGTPINGFKIAITVGIIFILFLFLGKNILNLLHVDIESFAVAGSFVLFLIALELILGIEIHKAGDTTTGNKIVPIAFPLIAGPGSLTLILTLEADYHTENIIVAILLNVIIIFFLIKFSDLFGRYLSDGILSVIKKVFGIILLAISVRLFGDYAPLLFGN